MATKKMKLLRVTKELTGVWEVWVYNVPADKMTYEDLDTEFHGSLVESGFETETIVSIEED